MFAPEGTVYLCSVPWSNSYQHVYHDGLGNAGNIIDNFGWGNGRTDNYTYIREHNNIRVPYNTDSIYGVNYCVYQNNGKWFFSFVTSIEYINNNTSLLHLEQDVFQTWGANINWSTVCYVEREHVNTDVVGQWRAPEPAFTLEPVTVRTYEFTNLDEKTIIIATNAIPHLKSGVSGTIFTQHTADDFDGSDPVEGGLYGGIFSGARLYAFRDSDSALAAEFLTNLNLCGAAESVSAMWMMPSACVTITDNNQVGLRTHFTGSFNAPNTHGGGYVPRNNKLLLYPYTFATVMNFNGGTVDLKFEDFSTYGDIQYQIDCAIDPSAATYFRATNYQVTGTNNDTLLPLTVCPQCSWPYGAYQNWLAQNQDKISSATMWNALQGIGGVVTLAAAVALFASGVGSAGGAALLAETIGTGKILTAGAAAAGAAISAAKSADTLEASIESQSKVPNHVGGSTSSNALYGVGLGSAGISCYGLQYDCARRIDQFFDVFGYQIDEKKIPNFTGRPSWNYVKTINANLGGNVPTDALALINKCLDAGVTFWHTTQVGNYALANSL